MRGNSRSILAACGLWTLLNGCGQATGHQLGGDASQRSGIVGPCRSGAGLELIDDMEDGDGKIISYAGRTGNWFASNDKTGTQSPELGSQIFPMWPIDPPRGTSQWAVRTSGLGFTDWGAQVGFDFAAQDQYDASAYAGIAFWARGSASLPEQHVRFNVTDVNTAQFGRVCDIDCGEDFSAAAEAGQSDGICDESRGPCHDYFGADFGAELGVDWREFRYTWDQLATRDWSKKHLSAIVTGKLYGLRFQTDPESDFDFWLDDIAFICR